MTKPKHVLVTGASGLLGTAVTLSLSALGFHITAIGRGSCPSLLEPVCDWQGFDLSSHSQFENKAEILIHCAPLWLLPEFLKTLLSLGCIKRCIALSSTSAVAKFQSPDKQDKQLAQTLRVAEDQVLSLSAEGLTATILRPSMIYGHAQDKNISVIANFIKQYGFFPVAGRANGLRQPVHVDDLVTAIVEIIENPHTSGKVYTLAGAEKISYVQMLERIFAGLGKPRRIIRLPVVLYRLLLAVQGSDYSPGTANRMNQNLDYDITAAVDDFNYKPQAFLTNPQQDLP